MRMPTTNVWVFELSRQDTSITVKASGDLMRMERFKVNGIMGNSWFGTTEKR